MKDLYPHMHTVNGTSGFGARVGRGILIAGIHTVMVDLIGSYSNLNILNQLEKSVNALVA